jgi:prepilin-type N-terminal cleavage/methylation domain-containing protein
MTRPSRRSLRCALRSALRHGFTIIEFAIVLGVIAIMLAIAIPNIDFQRFRLDAGMRNIQNQLLGAQYTAVQKNVPVIVTFFYTQSQFRIVTDLNSSGTWNTNEPRNWRTLSEGTKFVIPPRTIDGASAYYATGPGIFYLNATGQASTCATCPTMTFYPNGSTSGDVVVYLGSGQSTQQSAFRAIQIFGSTSKLYLWRMMSDGSWKKSDQ